MSSPESKPLRPLQPQMTDREKMNLPERISWKENEVAVLAFAGTLVALMFGAVAYVALNVPALGLWFVVMTLVVALVPVAGVLIYRKLRPEAVEAALRVRGEVARIIPRRGIGLVSIGSAGMLEVRSVDESEIQVGTRVEVVARRGVVAYVRRIEN